MRAAVDVEHAAGRAHGFERAIDVRLYARAEARVRAVELAHQVDVADDLGLERRDQIRDRIEVARVQRVVAAELLGQRARDLGFVVDELRRRRRARCRPCTRTRALRRIARMRSAQSPGGRRSVSKPTMQLDAVRVLVAQLERVLGVVGERGLQQRPRRRARLRRRTGRLRGSAGSARTGRTA